MGEVEFSQPSSGDGCQASLLPYIRTFVVAMPLSLKECAGWIPINFKHSKCAAPDGFDQSRQLFAKCSESGWQHQAKFGEQAPDLVGLGRVCADEALTNPMQREHRLLLDAIDRDKAHVRPGDRFADYPGFSSKQAARCPSSSTSAWILGKAPAIPSSGSPFAGQTKHSVHFDKRWTFSWTSGGFSVLTRRISSDCIAQLDHYSRYFEGAGRQRDMSFGLVELPMPRLLIDCTDETECRRVQL